MNIIILFIVIANKKLDTWDPLPTSEDTTSEDTTMRGSV